MAAGPADGHPGDSDDMMTGTATKGDVEPRLGQVRRRVARILQKSLQRPIVIGRLADEQMPGAFIIAPPRSGTTLLRLIFDTHPDIAAPPETLIFPYLLGALREERVTRAMWNVGFHRDSLARSLGDFARGFVEAYARTKQKRYWVEKTTTHVEWLPELREAFPDVRFVLLYRHPFDVVRSMMERNMIEVYDRFAPWRRDHPSTFAACCAYVARQQEAMLAFHKQHRRCVHAIRYERLVANPERELRDVCAFLGVAFAPQMLDFASARHDIGFGDEKIHQTTEIISRVDTFSGWSDNERHEARGYLRACLDGLEYAG
ncbi:MAG: sulfotransferase [Pseudomonadota bacterium]